MPVVFALSVRGRPVSVLQSCVVFLGIFSTSLGLSQADNEGFRYLIIPLGRLWHSVFSSHQCEGLQHTYPFFVSSLYLLSVG